MRKGEARGEAKRKYPADGQTDRWGMKPRQWRMKPRRETRLRQRNQETEEERKHRRRTGGETKEGEGGEEEQSGSEGGEGLEEAARLWAGPGRPPPGTGQTGGGGCGGPLRGHRLCESV